MTMHMFDTKEAEQHDIESAILLQNIRFWLDKNQANKKHIHDGYVWTYNSASAFGKLFPYIKQRTISRRLKELVDKGVLKVGVYNKSKYDQTRWYTIPSEFAINLEAPENATCQNDQSGCQDGESKSLAGKSTCQNDEPIPNINTFKKTNTTTTSKKPTNKTKIAVPKIESSSSSHLIFPKCLQYATLQENAIIKLKDFDTELQQVMLDTVAFQEKHNGFTKSALIFLSALIKSYLKGTFDYSGAIETQRIRENHQRAVLREQQMEMRRNHNLLLKNPLESKPAVKNSQIAKAGIKGLKAALGQRL